MSRYTTQTGEKHTSQRYTLRTNSGTSDDPATITLSNQSTINLSSTTNSGGIQGSYTYDSTGYDRRPRDVDVTVERHIARLAPGVRIRWYAYECAKPRERAPPPDTLPLERRIQVLVDSVTE